jgi:type IV pilus assembly protein PilB
MSPSETPQNLPLIVELIRKRGQINDKQVTLIMREQERRNCTYEEAMLFLKLTSEEVIAQVFAEYLAIPLVTSIDAIVAMPELASTLSSKFCQENHILPLRQKGTTLEVAFFDPTNQFLLEQIQLFTGLSVGLHVAPMHIIGEGLPKIFKQQGDQQQNTLETVEESAVEVTKEEGDDALDLDHVIPDIPETQVFRMVNAILATAMKERASDIHLEPFEDEAYIRIRIDGSLNNLPAPPVHQFVPLISRLKVLSKMDIAEKRLPQDGAFAIKSGGNIVDLRVSTVPTVHGEKMVLRLLNKAAVPLDLHKLGLDGRQCEDFVAAAQSPHGMLFVTGPTGSGKSTTLYATLNLLQDPTKNIVTVEDPVEYKFKGINQVQVKHAIDLKFTTVLRAFLRQDPDVIMVGEVRDQETAEICLRAALTGHFVLSTLHTNSALAAVNRLAEMGIEPFLIASTLRLVQAQRLVRRLCPECKEPYEAGDDLGKYGIAKGTVLFRPKGCPACRKMGYRGRVGLFEVFRIIPELRDLIETKASLPKMEEAGRKAGMKTLLDDGIVKVLAGSTSMEEVVSTTTGG